MHGGGSILSDSACGDGCNAFPQILTVQVMYKRGV